MRASMSHCPDNPASAGLTAESTERYYDILDRKRNELDDARGPGEASFEDNNGTGEDEEARKEDLGDDDSEASGVVDSTEVDPGNAIATKMHLEAALQAFQMHDKDAFVSAITSLTKLGLELDQTAKVAAVWAKEHPCFTNAIALSLALFALTPAIIGLAGFGAGGIAAGSVAAGIQSGIGNMVAGSVFAVLTSAGMGGAGLAAVMRVSACIPAAVVGFAALWMRWQKKRKIRETRWIETYRRGSAERKLAQRSHMRTTRRYRRRRTMPPT